MYKRILLGFVVLPLEVIAVGTPAGTAVVNTATVTFEVDDAPGQASSNDQFSVAEIIDVAVVWQDGADLRTASPDTGVLTFLISNIGNGDEAFSLRVNNRGCDTAPCAPRPGATIRYTIEADVTQVPMDDLLVTDPIPANTSYVDNSISLDAVGQTDVADGDPGSLVADTVNVNLGDVTAAATYAITFDVTID